MRILILLLFILSTFVAEAQKKPVIAKKSKLCGDTNCNEVLFKSKVIRSFPSNHPSFLNLPPEAMGKQLEILAIKYSDRTDIAEGRMEDGSRGDFYLSAVEKGPYVEYLRNAIETKKIMYQISREGDVGDSKLLGDIHSEADLVRDFNVRAREYALEQGLPEPEALPVPEPTPKGHGHSHDHGHSHSHGHSHGHSHEQPQPNEQPATTPPPAAALPVPEKPPVPHMIHPSMATPIGGNTPPPPAQQNTPPVTPPPVAVPPVTPVPTAAATPPQPAVVSPPGQPIPETLTNNLDNLESATNSSEDALSKIDMETMEAEIERMMREDEENLRRLKTQSAQAVADEVQAVAGEGHAEQAQPPVESTTAQPPLILESLKEPVDVPVPEPVTTPAPVVVESVSELPPVTYPPPIEPTTTAPLPPVVEEASTTTVTSVPQPVEAVPEPVKVEPTPVKEDEHGHAHEHAHRHVGYEHSHHDDHHGHSHEAPPVPVPVEAIPEDPKQTAEEEKRDIPVEAPKAEPLSSHEKRKYLEEEQLNYKAVSPPSGPGIFGSLVSSITGTIRAVLPLGEMSDAGVGLVFNVLFLFVALLFHLVSKMLSDGGDHIGTNARDFHVLVNTNKALQAQLALMEENKRRQVSIEEANNLRSHAGVLELQVKQLKDRAERAEKELEKEQRVREQLDQEREAGRDAQRVNETKIRDLERQLETSRGHQEEALKKLKEANAAREKLESALKEETTSKEQLSSQLEKTKLSLKDAEDELATTENKAKELEATKRALEEDLHVMNELVEQLQSKKESEAGESGGSGGWSDFGDEPEVNEKEDKQKTPPINLADFRETVKLKNQVTKLEQDYEQAKQNLEREVKEKKKLEQELSSMKQELESKMRELEARESYRREAEQRTNDLIQMVRDKDTKKEELDKTCQKLRDDVMDLTKDMASKESKIKELDGEVKKWRNDFLKLEASSYAKETDLTKKLIAAQSLQALAPPMPYDLAHNLSSDREHAPSRTEHVPTWDQPDPLPRSRTFSPDEDFMSGSLPPKKTSRSRRSDRVRDPSPSDGEKRRDRKEAGPSRRRSRSHGRQIFTGPMGPMPPYMPGGPGYPPMSGGYPSMPIDHMYFGGELNRRHSRSGHIYYSSGGSNGGKSPPPEMPLVSAQPPPGTRRPKPRDLNDFKPN